MLGSVLLVGALIGATQVSPNAHGACYGSAAFQTCNHASGNSYTVNRFGNMTTLQGSNLNTGSQWNETVQRFVNMTTYNAMTNGRPWNMQEQILGGRTMYNGMNSQVSPSPTAATNSAASESLELENILRGRA